MSEYRDLSGNDEDTRIGVIINELLKRPKGQIIGVCVDKELNDAKARRYITKLQERETSIELIDMVDGPTPGVTTLRIMRS